MSPLIITRERLAMALVLLLIAALHILSTAPDAGALDTGHRATRLYSKGVGYFSHQSSAGDNLTLAIDAFTEVLVLVPDHKDARNARGAAYYLLGWYDLALDDYAKALRLDPESGSIRANMRLARWKLHASTR